MPLAVRLGLLRKKSMSNVLNYLSLRKRELSASHFFLFFFLHFSGVKINFFTGFPHYKPFMIAPHPSVLK